MKTSDEILSSYGIVGRGVHTGVYFLLDHPNIGCSTHRDGLLDWVKTEMWSSVAEIENENKIL